MKTVAWMYPTSDTCVTTEEWVYAGGRRLVFAGTAEAEIQSLKADFEEVTESRNRLVRKIDVILNGEDGAAKQASLCDLVHQIQSLKTELEAARKDAERYRWLRDSSNDEIAEQLILNHWESGLDSAIDAAIEQAKGGV